MTPAWTRDIRGMILLDGPEQTATTQIATVTDDKPQMLSETIRDGTGAHRLTRSVPGGDKTAS